VIRPAWTSCARWKESEDGSLRAGLADLRVRLGIATGIAVVGDLIGEGAAQEPMYLATKPSWKR
jgi:class 3 adenylate cyclase